MRNLLMIAAFALLSPAPEADACGGGSYLPEPQAFVISSHLQPRPRTFVLLDEPSPMDAMWASLAPLDYDRAGIAPAPALAAPIELTLVGPSGTRVVKARHKVWLSRAWRAREPSAALEIDLRPGDNFHIALPGALTGNAAPAWVPLEAERATRAHVAWLAAQGIAVAGPEQLAVWRLRGSGFETLRFFDERGAVTVVRKAGRLLSRVPGEAIAAYALPTGHRTVVISGPLKATPVYVGL